MTYERHFLQEPHGGARVRWYWVTDGRDALVLMTEDPRPGFRSKDFLSAHRDGGLEECRFLPSGRCNCSCAGLCEISFLGDGPLADHGIPSSLVQPPEFWQWMEATFVSHVLRRTS